VKNERLQKGNKEGESGKRRKKERKKEMEKLTDNSQ
jgi:hypothetical protein